MSSFDWGQDAAPRVATPSGLTVRAASHLQPSGSSLRTTNKDCGGCNPRLNRSSLDVAFLSRAATWRHERRHLAQHLQPQQPGKPGAGGDPRTLTTTLSRSVSQEVSPLHRPPSFQSLHHYRDSARMPPPHHQPLLAQVGVDANYYNPVPMSDDLPVDFLEGRMDLRVVLPTKECIRMSVERRTPMMDLLILATSANGISPGGHVVQVLNDRSDDLLYYKPSTPIGALDTSTIHIVPKHQVSNSALRKAPVKMLNQPFETTFRLQVRLPKNQLSVMRVSPKTKVSEVLHQICADRLLDPVKFEVRHPDNPDERLCPDASLADYRLIEVAIVPVSKATSKSVSTSDILRLQSDLISAGSRLPQLEIDRSRLSAGESSMSSESAYGGDRRGSPDLSLTHPVHPVMTTQSNMGHSSRHRNTSSTISQSISVKKRRAPPPPGSSRTSTITTSIADRTGGDPAQRSPVALYVEPEIRGGSRGSGGGVGRRLPAVPPFKTVSMTSLSTSVLNDDMSVISCTSVGSVTSLGFKKRRAPQPPSRRPQSVLTTLSSSGSTMLAASSTLPEASRALPITEETPSLLQVEETVDVCTPMSLRGAKDQLERYPATPEPLPRKSPLRASSEGLPGDGGPKISNSSSSQRRSPVVNVEEAPDHEDKPKGMAGCTVTKSSSSLTTSGSSLIKASGDDVHRGRRSRSSIGSSSSGGSSRGGSRPHSFVSNSEDATDLAQGRNSAGPCHTDSGTSPVESTLRTFAATTTDTKGHHYQAQSPEAASAMQTESQQPDRRSSYHQALQNPFVGSLLQSPAPSTRVRRLERQEHVSIKSMDYDSQDSTSGQQHIGHDDTTDPTGAAISQTEACEPSSAEDVVERVQLRRQKANNGGYGSAPPAKPPRTFSAIISAESDHDSSSRIPGSPSEPGREGSAEAEDDGTDGRQQISADQGDNGDILGSRQKEQPDPESICKDGALPAPVIDVIDAVQAPDAGIGEEVAGHDNSPTAKCHHRHKHKSKKNTRESPDESGDSKCSKGHHHHRRHRHHHKSKKDKPGKGKADTENHRSAEMVPNQDTSTSPPSSGEMPDAIVEDRVERRLEKTNIDYASCCDKKNDGDNVEDMMSPDNLSGHLSRSSSSSIETYAVTAQTHDLNETKEIRPILPLSNFVPENPSIIKEDPQQIPKDMPDAQPSNPLHQEVPEASLEETSPLSSFQNRQLVSEALDESFATVIDFGPEDDSDDTSSSAIDTVHKDKPEDLVGRDIDPTVVVVSKVLVIQEEGLSDRFDSSLQRHLERLDNLLVDPDNNGPPEPADQDPSQDPLDPKASPPDSPFFTGMRRAELNRGLVGQSGSGSNTPKVNFSISSYAERYNGYSRTPSIYEPDGPLSSLPTTQPDQNKVVQLHVAVGRSDSVQSSDTARIPPGVKGIASLDRPPKLYVVADQKVDYLQEKGSQHPSEVDVPSDAESTSDWRHKTAAAVQSTSDGPHKMVEVQRLAGKDLSTNGVPVASTTTSGGSLGPLPSPPQESLRDIREDLASKPERPSTDLSPDEIPDYVQGPKDEVNEVTSNDSDTHPREATSDQSLSDQALPLPALGLGNSEGKSKSVDLQATPIRVNRIPSRQVIARKTSFHSERVVPNDDLLLNLSRQGKAPRPVSSIIGAGNSSIPQESEPQVSSKRKTLTDLYLTSLRERSFSGDEHFKRPLVSTRSLSANRTEGVSPVPPSSTDPEKALKGDQDDRKLSKTFDSAVENEALTKAFNVDNEQEKVAPVKGEGGEGPLSARAATTHRPASQVAPPSQSQVDEMLVRGGMGGTDPRGVVVPPTVIYAYTGPPSVQMTPWGDRNRVGARSKSASSPHHHPGWQVTSGANAHYMHPHLRSTSIGVTPHGYLAAATPTSMATAVPGYHPQVVGAAPQLVFFPQPYQFVHAAAPHTHQHPAVQQEIKLSHGSVRSRSSRMENAYRSAVEENQARSNRRRLRSEDHSDEDADSANDTDRRPKGSNGGRNRTVQSLKSQGSPVRTEKLNKVSDKVQEGPVSSMGLKSSKNNNGSLKGSKLAPAPGKNIEVKYVGSDQQTISDSMDDPAEDVRSASRRPNGRENGQRESLLTKPSEAPFMLRPKLEPKSIESSVSLRPLQQFYFGQHPQEDTPAAKDTNNGGCNEEDSPMRKQSAVGKVKNNEALSHPKRAASTSFGPTVSYVKDVPQVLTSSRSASPMVKVVEQQAEVPQYKALNATNIQAKKIPTAGVGPSSPASGVSSAVSSLSSPSSLSSASSSSKIPPIATDANDKLQSGSSALNGKCGHGNNSEVTMLVRVKYNTHNQMEDEGYRSPSMSKAEEDLLISTSGAGTSSSASSANSTASSADFEVPNPKVFLRNKAIKAETSRLLMKSQILKEGGAAHFLQTNTPSFEEGVRLDRHKMVSPSLTKKREVSGDEIRRAFEAELIESKNRLKKRQPPPHGGVPVMPGATAPTSATYGSESPSDAIVASSRFSAEVELGFPVKLPPAPVPPPPPPPPPPLPSSHQNGQSNGFLGKIRIPEAPRMMMKLGNGKHGSKVTSFPSSHSSTLGTNGGVTLKAVVPLPASPAAVTRSSQGKLSGGGGVMSAREELMMAIRDKGGIQGLRKTSSGILI